MQARYITYLALALEADTNYSDGRGQQYYLDQVLNQNSRKQKALKDVMDNLDPQTGIWPEVAHYSIMVSDELSTKKGDLKGYDYFTHKKRVDFTH